MIHNITIQLILFLAFNFSAFGQTEKKALVLLKKYDKDGYFIINEYRKAPGSYKFENISKNISKNNRFDHFIFGTKKQDIINSLGIVVHEMNHAFTGIYAYQKIKEYEFGAEYDCFYIKDKRTIIVKHTETFPSRLIIKTIPEKLQTFRFATYISESSEYQSTQNAGIYGLLDEFNAYYQGTKTNFLMYDYYLNETSGGKKDWLNYMSNFDGAYYAYAEFRFYILKYLLFAKENKKEIYKEIIKNKEFKDAFNAVDKEFSSLIITYFAKRDKILKRLEEKGFTTSVSDKYTYVDGYGTGNFLDTYKLLTDEMKQTKYTMMINELKK